MEKFKEKFKTELLLIHEFQYWGVSLRPQQITLGSLVLYLKRACPELGNITAEEASELSDVFKFVQQLLSKSLKPDKLNYLALMMVDHHVHFHVIPRYEKRLEFDHRIYIDESWPKPPDLSTGLNIEEPVMQKLKRLLIKCSKQIDISS